MEECHVLSQVLRAAALSLFASMSSAAPFPERELTGVIMWGRGARRTSSRARSPRTPSRRWARRSCWSTRRAHRRDLDELRQQRAVRRLHAALRRRKSAAAPVLASPISGTRSSIRQRARARRRRHRREERCAVELVKDFVEDAKKRPGSSRWVTARGLPHTVARMLNSITKFQVISVPFDGEGPADGADGRHVDMMPVGAGRRRRTSSRAREGAGRHRTPTRCRCRGARHCADHQGLPRFAKYLPWGRSTACS